MSSSIRQFAAQWRRILIGLALVGIIVYYFFGRGTALGATLLIAPSDFREQVSVSGTVTAARDVSLGFAANGRIAATYATVGQHVVQGATLAEIENGDLVASLAQKQAIEQQARANLESLMRGTRPEEVAVAQTAVTNARAVLFTALQAAYTASDDAVHNRVDSFVSNPRTQPKLLFSVPSGTLATTFEQERVALEPMLLTWSARVATLTPETAATAVAEAKTYLARVTNLLSDANMALSQAVVDQSTSAATLASYSAALGSARTAVNTAAANLAADSAALDAAQSTLALKQSGSTEDAIAAQEALVASAAAEVRAATAQLAKTRVVAPFSGIVTRMDAKTGQVVSPSTSEISLQSDGIFQIETFIPEVTIARVARGNAATTTLDAYGTSVPFPSVVVSVDPAETIKDGVPTYKTTLSFLAEDARIRSGMTANVTIETGQLKNAIVVPAGAVGTKDGASYVSVVEKNAVYNRSVTLGASPALGQAQIISGLSSGERILLAPIP